MPAAAASISKFRSLKFARPAPQVGHIETDAFGAQLDAIYFNGQARWHEMEPPQPAPAAPSSALASASAGRPAWCCAPGVRCTAVKTSRRSACSARRWRWSAARGRRRCNCGATPGWWRWSRRAAAGAASARHAGRAAGLIDKWPPRRFHTLLGSACVVQVRRLAWQGGRNAAARGERCRQRAEAEARRLGMRLLPGWD